MSSAPHPKAHERQIDWVRAAFAGAIAGGVLWAVVVKVLSVLDKSLSMEVRLLYAAGGVCLPVLVAGLLLLRAARRPASRTAAAAMLIAPGPGVVLILLLFAIGLPGWLTRQ